MKEITIGSILDVLLAKMETMETTQNSFWETEDGVVAISYSKLRAMLIEYGKSGKGRYKLAECESLAFGIKLDAGTYPYIPTTLELVDDIGPTSQVFQVNIWLDSSRTLIEFVSEQKQED